MKRKSVRLVLSLGILAAALTCSALAAGENTGGYTTAEENCEVTWEDGKYTVSASTAAGIQPGNEYVLLVVRSEEGGTYSVSQDTIMYIDQKAATESGVEFAGFIPKSTPDCVVLLGGVFSGETTSPKNSPKKLGTLIGQGVTVSGSVEIGVDVTSNITLTLYDQSGSPVSDPAAMGSDGSYSIPSVSEGTYYIKASKPGFISEWVALTVTGEGDISAISVPLYGGDVNEDTRINSADLMLILNDFGKSGAGIENTYADINEDQRVNTADLYELLDNFGMAEKQSPTE